MYIFFFILPSQLNDTRRLDLSINSYFKLATANQRVRERYGKAVIDISGHETVLRPRETIQRLCEHLRVTCSDDYLDKCSNITEAVADGECW